MVTDQNDACCLVPDCPKTPAPTYIPTLGPHGETVNPTPTPGPGVVTPSPQPTRTVPFLPNPNGKLLYLQLLHGKDFKWNILSMLGFLPII